MVTGCVLIVSLTSGCGVTKTLIDNTKRDAKNPSVVEPYVPETYVLTCPDQVAIRVRGRPDCTATVTVDAEGKITLGPFGPIRVEGMSAETLAEIIARIANVDETDVHVQIVGYQSRKIYLFGPVNGVPRAVDYRGPETVTELLQRTGGLRPGAAIDEIHVVRPGIASGFKPQIFHIQIDAKGEPQNPAEQLHLQPYDEVYIGETRRSMLTKAIHPLLKPFWKAINGLLPRQRPVVASAQHGG